MQKITPFLWFDTQAEAAANFYVSIFKNSKIVNMTRYGGRSRQVLGKAL
jgi:predicted 3-demethylubiquinone-9 3-methyltransferase (glyoxalase superfamily)